MADLLKLIEAGYKAALAEKFPTLEVNSIVYLSEGWESVVYLVNGSYVFRFPKREITGNCLKLEINLLPKLLGRSNLALPNFEYISTEPGAHFPYPFVGYKMLPGEPLRKLAANENWWQASVLNFLNTLHSFPVEEARQLGAGYTNWIAKNSGENAPEPTSWRQGLSDFYEFIRQKAFPLLTNPAKVTIGQHFEDFLGDERNFEYKPVLIHGDFSKEHILLDAAQQKVTGIIDFGDMAIGDPLVDVWPTLLPGYKHNIGPNSAIRHNFYGEVLPPFYLIIFGLAYGDSQMVEVGISRAEEFYRNNRRD